MNHPFPHYLFMLFNITLGAVLGWVWQTTPYLFVLSLSSNGLVNQILSAGIYGLLSSIAGYAGTLLIDKARRWLREPRRYTPTCIICNKKFVSHRPEAKCCSKPCRNKAFRRRKKKKETDSSSADSPSPRNQPGTHE